MKLKVDCEVSTNKNKEWRLSSGQQTLPYYLSLNRQESLILQARLIRPGTDTKLFG